MVSRALPQRSATPLESCEMLVHLDLKGAPPTMDYLCGLLPLLRKWGATGLLVEWEDMLPWGPPFEDLRHPDAYSEADLRRFADKCRALKLEVVPLVQTFGHMEFVLKHRRFASLREESDNFMDLCPEASGAPALARALLAEVVRLHK